MRDARFAGIYPHYLAKVERNGHTQEELDQVITWLTGDDRGGLDRVMADEVDLRTFFGRAPAMNASATLITGVICGVRVEDVEDPLMQQIRWMDKLVEEVSRGKKRHTTLRVPA